MEAVASFPSRKHSSGRWSNPRIGSLLQPVQKTSRSSNFTEVQFSHSHSISKGKNDVVTKTPNHFLHTSYIPYTNHRDTHTSMPLSVHTLYPFMHMQSGHSSFPAHTVKYTLHPSMHTPPGHQPFHAHPLKTPTTPERIIISCDPTNGRSCQGHGPNINSQIAVITNEATSSGEFV